MPHTRNANTRLAGVISETGLSHAQVARAVVRVALENDAQELATVGRSHVSHWVSGSRPSGRSPAMLREALSRRLGRVVTLDEIGLTSAADEFATSPEWRADTLATLADLGRLSVDVERRRVLQAAAYSVAALSLPNPEWWAGTARRPARTGATTSRLIGHGDVEAVRDMAQMFSRVDQRRGGGHARTAVVQYLTSDVSAAMRGRFQSDDVRRSMFSAASELAYLCGWMAFDNAEHAIAQHYFTVAVKLAAEADDPPMAGHVLRAMAHQALELGHRNQALELASASVADARYALASPRERALLGVVYARTLAGAGNRKAAATALTRAEDDLAQASPGDDEPARVFFFGEASLAHETACTLRDSGDLTGATREFRRSVRTRQAASFTRTHAVTLGYLGAVQARQGAIEEACTNWSRALDVMDSIQSARTRQVVLEMRSMLSPLRRRDLRVIAELDSRAVTHLSRIG